MGDVTVVMGRQRVLVGFRGLVRKDKFPTKSTSDIHNHQPTRPRTLKLEQKAAGTEGIGFLGHGIPYLHVLFGGAGWSRNDPRSRRLAEINLVANRGGENLSCWKAIWIGRGETNRVTDLHNFTVTWVAVLPCHGCRVAKA